MSTFNYLTMTDLIWYPEVIKLCIVAFAVGMLASAVVFTVSDMIEWVVGKGGEDE